MFFAWTTWVGMSTSTGSWPRHHRRPSHSVREWKGKRVLGGRAGGRLRGGRADSRHTGSKGHADARHGGNILCCRRVPSGRRSFTSSRG